MADQWQPIHLSAKAFGHLSQGLYRTPAGAVKELISNSFDADARLVRIHTDFPRFETFSCEDNGTGISRDEFSRLMDRGIGSSYKRSGDATVSAELHRPLIGRLGLGILSLAQICTQFDIVSHSKNDKTAFRATIKFPPYTRAEMDKISARVTDDERERIVGGQFLVSDETYDPAKKGVRVFTRHLREPFRKRMRSTLSRLANKKVFKSSEPYKSFDRFLDAIYNPQELTLSLNERSDYDQFIFGLALAAPLPFLEERNLVVKIPSVKEQQAALKKFDFQVKVDNLSLANPVCLPSDRAGHTAGGCRFVGSEKQDFVLTDGPVTESCKVVRHDVEVKQSDERFHVYELEYSKKDVAGTPLSFRGYLFLQTGRLYPRDIQGVLVRLSNVAIGKYDNSMLTYPYGEGPRYSMVSSELRVQAGFDDALNIDRDSFNELHPHFMRTQAYIHSLLHGLIFPAAWGEEKERNKNRRAKAAEAHQSRFIEKFKKTTGDTIRSIQRVEKTEKRQERRAQSEPAVDFDVGRGRVEIDRTHPLLQPLFRRKKYAALIEQIVVAFERSNNEAASSKRRELFYKLLAQIFTDL